MAFNNTSCNLDLLLTFVLLYKHQARLLICINSRKESRESKDIMSTEEDIHRVFRNRPLELVKYLNCVVEFNTRR